MPKTVVDELEDVEPEEDFFEKLLKEEIDPNAESKDEKEADSKTEKDSPNSAAENKDDEETVESLKAKIAEMERERKGQLDSVVKSRQERARFKSELSDLKEAVSSLLAQRSSAVKDALADEEKKEPLSDPKAKVEFDESGDSAYVDLSAVKEALTKETASTKEEIKALREEREIEAAKQAFQANVMSVVDENREVFGEAYQKLTKIYQDLNDKVIELQERTGEVDEDGTLSQDRALELFIGSPEEKEFLKEYPGIDSTRVARALNSKVDLRIGLKHLADTLKIGVKDDDDKGGVLDEKLKAAQSKPGGLANHGNQNGEDNGDLIGRIASLSVSDMEDLSDAEVAKIEAMLLREEMKSN